MRITAFRFVPKFVHLIAAAAALLFRTECLAEDWPMYGRDATRNPVSPETNAPVHWDIHSGVNIKWKARLGAQTYSDPIIANGLIWIGTMTDRKENDDGAVPELAVLKCFRESDGALLYQFVVPDKPGMGRVGVRTFNGSPLVQSDKLWFTTLTGDVHHFDLAPLLARGEPPRELWKVDMPEEFGVFPRNPFMADGRTCSLSFPYRDRIYVVTGNGVGPDLSVSMPLAPSLVCLEKDTGKLLWENNSPGQGIIYGQWGSPLVAEIGGRAQVITPQGDG
jgi:outer membrane protein assembly factor BamB